MRLSEKEKKKKDTKTFIPFLSQTFLSFDYAMQKCADIHRDQKKK